MLRFNIEGKILLAMAMMNETFYMGLAKTNEPWGYDDVPMYDGDNLELLGFLKEQHKSYVLEDEDGALKANGKRYSYSDVPTNTVAVSFLQDGDDLDGKTIYQQLVGARLSVVNENKMWNEIDDVDSDGFVVIAGGNVAPYSLSVGSSETLTIVMNF